MGYTYTKRGKRAYVIFYLADLLQGGADSGAEVISETNIQKSGYKNRGTLVNQGKEKRENSETREAVLQLICHIHVRANQVTH